MYREDIPHGVAIKNKYIVVFSSLILKLAKITQEDSVSSGAVINTVIRERTCSYSIGKCRYTTDLQTRLEKNLKNSSLEK